MLVAKSFFAASKTFAGVTVYLKIYGVKLNCSQAERVAVTMNVAANQMSFNEILAWLRQHIT